MYIKLPRVYTYVCRMITGKCETEITYYMRLSHPRLSYQFLTDFFKTGAGLQPSALLVSAVTGCIELPLELGGPKLEPISASDGWPST